MDQQGSNGVTVLLIPGLWNSGPEHWQSYWERTRTDCTRVVQDDWKTPRCRDWLARIDAAVAAAAGPVVLAGHSLGCATIAHWAGAATPAALAKVRGALLVGPSDPEAPQYPQGTEGFAPLPGAPLPFPSILVLSTDDVWVTVARARSFARAWGSRVVDAGPRGHLNADSRLGAWPEGQALVAELAQGSNRSPAGS